MGWLHDSGVAKKECVHMLFVDLDLFKVKVTFFALKDVPSVDVQRIYSAIKSAFKTQIWSTHCLKLCFLVQMPFL